MLKINKNKSFRNIRNGFDVKEVSGLEIRNTCDPDYGVIGSSKIYPYIPKNEIWIEEDVVFENEPELLAHEITEWYQMKYDNIKYKQAHSHSESIEKALRTINTLYQKEKK